MRRIFNVLLPALGVVALGLQAQVSPEAVEGALDAVSAQEAQVLDAVPGGVAVEACFVAPEAGAIVVPRVLTLQETFRLIQDENLTVLLQREAVEAALQQSYVERSRLLPQVRFDANQQRAQYVNAGRGFGNFPNGPPENRFDAVIRGEMSVLDLRRIADWRLAQMGYEVSQLNYRSVQQDILREAGQAYFDHLRALSRLEVIQANIDRDTILLDVANEQFNAGVATKLDITRAEVRLAGNEFELAQQETNVYQTGVFLKRLLDLDLDEPILLADPFMRDAPEPVPFDNQSILGRRVDYAQAEEQLAYDRYAAKAAGWEHYPTLGVFGDWGFGSSTPAASDTGQQWTIGVGLSVPIFEGFRIQSKQREAQANARGQEYAVRRLAEQIGEQYRNAERETQSRFRQMGIAQKRVSLAELELDLASNRFSEGVADNQEVVDAQANLASAEDEQVEAIYRFHLAQLNLSYALGEVRDILGEDKGAGFEE